MKYKVYTKWTGYSEIEVEAKSEDEAREMVDMGNYEPENYKFTGSGIDYGGEDEEVLEIEEIKDE